MNFQKDVDRVPEHLLSRRKIWCECGRAVGSVVSHEDASRGLTTVTEYILYMR